MPDFSQQIISWYKRNKRDLPWRQTTNPYFIWLSEIILQQTRVDQGLKYYYSFIEKYPTVKDLAAAPLDDVLKTWQGLGYYSRARNIHATANSIAKEHKGIFPENYDSIIKLKGIGPYTAAAISSFCYNEAQAVVDGNVYRVLSRYFGIETPIDSTEGKKQFQQLAIEVLSKKNPGLHNQAIMEFGALQCKPVNPDCIKCPLSASCVAFEKEKVNQLPVKTKKTKVRMRYFYYLLIEDATGQTWIRQRSGKDIWTGLFEFPLIESDKETTVEQILNSKPAKELLKGKEYSITKVSSATKHQLSHQTLHAVFIHIRIKSKLTQQPDFKLIKSNSIKDFALPRLIDRYLHG